MIQPYFSVYFEDIKVFHKMHLILATTWVTIFSYPSKENYSHCFSKKEM